MAKKDVIMIDGKKFPASMLSADSVRDHRLIEDAFKKRDAYLEAKAKFEKFLHEHVDVRLDELNEQLAEGSKLERITVHDVEQTRKIVVVRRTYMRLNEKANVAKAMIDKVLAELKDEAEGDKATLFEFLSGLFSGKRGLVMTNNVVTFTKMTFQDTRLIEAQELIKAAIEADQSRLYVNFYQKDERGAWQPLETF